jgi:hypothetical protein
MIENGYGSHSQFHKKVYESLKTAIGKNDLKCFDQILIERKEDIETIEDEAVKEEIILFWIEKDLEIRNMIRERMINIEEYLIGKNKQRKRAEIYER